MTIMLVHSQVDVTEELDLGAETGGTLRRLPAHTKNTRTVLLHSFILNIHDISLSPLKAASGLSLPSYRCHIASLTYYHKFFY